MKPTNLFNYCKRTLRHNATWSECRFLRVLMVVLMLCSMNGHIIAASVPLGTNIDSNINPSGSEDRFNAASFLQESNPPDADQYWSLGGKVGAVILGVAALAVIIKRCQYGHDSRNSINQAGTQSHLRDSTVLDHSTIEEENTISRTSPNTVVSNVVNSHESLDSLNDKGKNDRNTKKVSQSPHNGTVDDIKNQLLELDKSRKEREEQDNAISTANRTSGRVLFFQSWFAQKQSEDTKSKDPLDLHLEFNIGQARAKLNCCSDLDEIIAAFVDSEKEKLEEILKSISAEKSKSDDDIEQRKFALFVAKNKFSEGHLNGLLEALEKKAENQEFLDQIKQQADDYWQKKGKDPLMASAVNSYPVTADILSLSYLARARKDKKDHENQNKMDGDESESDDAFPSCAIIGQYLIVNGDDSDLDNEENSTSEQNKLLESEKSYFSSSCKKK